MATAASSFAAAAAAAAATDGGAARSPSLLPLPSSPAPPSRPSSSRRPPPPCWIHEETLALIESYRETWHALNRGNLRRSHWQEVADAVARRSLHLPAATPKTSAQCQNKIEKLRKRYRAERQRSLARDPSSPPISSWSYFPLMDAMEQPRSAPSRPRSPPSSSDSDSPEEEEEEDDDDDPRHRSIHRLIANSRPVPAPGAKPNPSSPYYRNGVAVSPAGGEVSRKLEKKRREREMEMEMEMESESDAVADMASALWTLGEKFMRMQQMRMEMAREMERARMEMELKSTEMILESQRLIASAFADGLLRKTKRAKRDAEF